jgi:hypothetical protein
VGPISNSIEDGRGGGWTGDSDPDIMGRVEKIAPIERAVWHKPIAPPRAEYGMAKVMVSASAMSGE